MKNFQIKKNQNKNKEKNENNEKDDDEDENEEEEKEEEEDNEIDSSNESFDPIELRKYELKNEILLFSNLF